MIDLKDVLNIHNILIDRFGGSKGIRDSGSIEAAILRLLIFPWIVEICKKPPIKQRWRVM